MEGADVQLLLNDLTNLYDQQQENSQCIRYRDHVFSFFHCRITGTTKKHLPFAGCTNYTWQKLLKYSDTSTFWGIRTVTDLVTISKVTNIWKNFDRVQGGEGIPWHIPSRLFQITRTDGISLHREIELGSMSLLFLSSQQALWTEGE